MKKVKNKVKSENGSQAPETATTAVVTDAPLHAGPGEYKIVPRDQVRPDPNQPRKSFDQAKLDELAENIRLNGIVSPLVVQAMPAKVKVEEPNMFHTDWQAVDTSGAVVAAGKEEMVRALVGGDAEPFYQIVFGERRWRAAGLAALKEIPVIVRELTEREVFVHQFVENQARENLSALEEAKSFAAEITKRKEIDQEFNAEKLAAELGIARGTVYNRLTLTRLTEPVLAALTAGTIQPTQAGLIAMIPDPKQQEKLLKKVSDENDWQFPFSFRDIEEIIEEDYCKQLKDAPFDLKNEMLFQGAVMLKGAWHLNDVKLGDDIVASSCQACPHRTGNMKEAFPHIKNEKVCTKPGCYTAKCTAHFLDEAAEAMRKGQKVLSLKEFKSVKSSYIAGDRHEYAHNRNGTFESLMGKHKPEPVLLVTDEGLKKFYPKEDALAAAKKNGVKFNREVDRGKEDKKRKENEARRDRRKKMVEGLRSELFKGLAALKDADAWSVMLTMLTRESHIEHSLKTLLAATKSPKAKALGYALSGYRSNPVTWEGGWDKDIKAIWNSAGVDLEAEERKSQASVELPLAKVEEKQKNLLMVKKNKKKK